MLNLTAYLDGILSLKSAKYPLFYNIITNYFTIDFQKVRSRMGKYGLRLFAQIIFSWQTFLLLHNLPYKYVERKTHQTNNGNW